MSLATTVLKLIALRGVTDYILNVVTSTGLIDPLFPTKGSVNTTVDHPLVAYPAAIANKQKTFEIVKKGDIKFYVDPTDMTVVPTTNDTVTHPTKGRFSIVDTITYTDAGVDILHILQIRK
jgi:hypothetical protein